MFRITACLMAAVFLVGGVQAQESGRRIEEAAYTSIGGIEQWVTIRGDDRRAPVLLLLHGGPGDVQSSFASTYAPYEKDFVLVQWDQRGAGQTYAKNGAAGVSLERLIGDGLELAAQLRKRFAGQKLLVFGHSWGSIIATGMVQRRPDLFDAYVGTGQVAAWADTVQFQFDFLRRRYAERGDTVRLAALDAIGRPDPLNVKQYFGFSRDIRQHMSSADAAWLARMRELASATGETAALVKAAGDGMNASGSALIQSTITTDLPATAVAFKLPYYVIQGRHDLFAPTALVEAYFAKVTAPRKRLVILESAGHFALSTHQSDVITALKAMAR